MSNKSLPDCRACLHSVAIKYQLSDKSWTPHRLYCKLWEGEVYTACPEFIYEPGTDVQELNVDNSVIRGQQK